MNFDQAKFLPGESVLFAGEITGVIEEVIWPRNSTSFLYLVEYWQDGSTRTVRVFEEDLQAAP